MAKKVTKQKTKTRGRKLPSRVTQTTKVERDTSTLTGRQQLKRDKYAYKNQKAQAKAKSDEARSKQRTISAIGTAGMKNIGAAGASTVGSMAVSRDNQALNDMQSTINGGVDEGQNIPTGTDQDDGRDLWG